MTCPIQKARHRKDAEAIALRHRIDQRRKAAECVAAFFESQPIDERAPIK